MNGSWQIGKVAGIPLKIHFSWFVIFGLITWSLATHYFPQVAPELPQYTNYLRGALAALLLFLSVTIHELSHSFVARRNSIPITSITLFIFGGIARMEKEPKSPSIEIKMALAGPFSSYFLALVFFLINKTADGYPGAKAITFYLYQINIILGSFNLIPGFPMDGGRVLRAILWRRTGDYLSATRRAAKAGQGIALFFVFFGIFSLFLGYAGSLWFLLIGWFLYTAAQSSYQQATTKSLLEGILVKDVMVREVVVVDPGVSVSDLVERYFLGYGYGGFPVVHNGTVAGIVSFREIKGIQKEKWPQLTVGEVMERLKDSLIISGNDRVSDVFDRMVQEDRGRFLVIEGRKLSGLITRSGIFKYLQIKKELKD